MEETRFGPILRKYLSLTNAGKSMWLD